MLLAAPNFVFGPASRGTPGAVALGDDNRGKNKGRALAVVLIGERPGLSACDRHGPPILPLIRKPGVTRDANRNCVSNIRGQGLSLDEASRRILAIMGLARTNPAERPHALRKTTLSIYCRQDSLNPITRRHPVLAEIKIIGRLPAVLEEAAGDRLPRQQFP